MTTPTTPYLRRRDVRVWLETHSPHLFREFEKLVENQAITRIKLSPNARGYYLTSEIESKILKPFRDAEQQLNPEPAATGREPQRH